MVHNIFLDCTEREVLGQFDLPEALKRKLLRQFAVICMYCHLAWGCDCLWQMGRPEVGRGPPREMKDKL